MRITRLQLARVRCITALDLHLSPGFNFIIGPNGAGKTSILEAVYVLSHGHSFRRRARESMIQRGASDFTVYAELGLVDGRSQRVGLARRSGGWEARIDQAPVARLADLFGAFAACAFAPGSHELLEGGPEGRRAFWDWGVFHVEPELLPTWRRYSRALAQRNALLRQRAADSSLLPFEAEMARAGTALAGWRQDYLSQLAPLAAAHAQALVPELGELSLIGQRGWRGAGEDDLAKVLAGRRDADRERGNSGSGPHRADWSLRFAQAPPVSELSRGQQKLAVLALVLAQAQAFQRVRGAWPVLLLDDLASELDAAHLQAALRLIEASGAQVLISGTFLAPALAERAVTGSLFHVEHGLRVGPDA